MFCGALEGLTEIPMSWFMPLVFVNRSAFPVMIALQLNGGVTLITRSVAPPVVGIMSENVWPLLPERPYCLLLTFVKSDWPRPPVCTGIQFPPVGPVGGALVKPSADGGGRKIHKYPKPSRMISKSVQTAFVPS